MSDKHAWTFFRTGGFDQVRLDSGADLLALRHLDQKLWVALSCPVTGAYFDPVTMRLLDADGDGHIRAADLIAALDFVDARLADKERLATGTDTLPLTAIDGATAEGARVLAAARRVLDSLGKPDSAVITIEDLADRARIFGQTRFNGDGIITTDTAERDDLKTLIADIGQLYGQQTDRSGQPGIDGPTIERFHDDVAALVAWLDAYPGQAACLADDEAALAALVAVRDKVDDYFTRCRLAAYDALAEPAVNGKAEDYAALARDCLAAPGDAVAALPLARAGAGRPLPLDGSVNPAWQDRLRAFRTRVVEPRLGTRTTLSETEWQALLAEHTALTAWQAARPQSLAGTLPAARLREVHGSDQRAELLALVARDLALADEFAAVDETEKLLYLVRDLLRFANNFAAFRDFYASREPAIFQAGTLYLDGRSSNLCVNVTDAGKHAALAGLARLYLVYCDCRRDGATMTIAAAITAGDADQIIVGRNGVFYDRDGKDWDATVVKIVDHPISLRQAFWAPYRKIARMIGEQIQKFAAGRQQAVETQAGTTIAAGAKKAETATAMSPGAPPSAPPAPFDVAKFAGIFAAIGLALGALGTAAAAILTGFLGLPWWQMPLAVLGLLLIVSGPSVLIAWFKLRARNLGPLLDANGWAVNSRARINLPFGRTLTAVATLPAGSRSSLADPYADRRHRWLWLGIMTAVLVAAVVWFARQAQG